MRRQARFCAADSPGYLFSEGALSCSAATARSRLAALYKANAPAPQERAARRTRAHTHAAARGSHARARTHARVRTHAHARTH
eukprot:6199653-Pleurochrysis_carterae.AAC.1